MKRELTRSLTLLSLIPVMLFTLAVILTTTPVMASTLYTYTFDSTLSPWTDKGDSGIGRSFTRGTDDNSASCFSFASGYALLANTTSVPAGQGIWMVAPFTVSGPGTVEVKWDARDPSGSCSTGNCKAVAYVGASAPTSSSVFSSRGVISSSWQGFSYGTTYTPPGPSSTVYVAVGWRAGEDSSTVVSGTVRHDCIRVSVP